MSRPPDKYSQKNHERRVLYLKEKWPGGQFIPAQFVHKEPGRDLVSDLYTITRIYTESGIPLHHMWEPASPDNPARGLLRRHMTQKGAHFITNSIGLEARKEATRKGWPATEMATPSTEPEAHNPETSGSHGDKANETPPGGVVGQRNHGVEADNGDEGSEDEDCEDNIEGDTCLGSPSAKSSGQTAGGKRKHDMVGPSPSALSQGTTVTADGRSTKSRRISGMHDEPDNLLSYIAKVDTEYADSLHRTFSQAPRVLAKLLNEAKKTKQKLAMLRLEVENKSSGGQVDQEMELLVDADDDAAAGDRPGRTQPSRHLDPLVAAERELGDITRKRAELEGQIGKLDTEVFSLGQIIDSLSRQLSESSQDISAVRQHSMLQMNREFLEKAQKERADMHVRVGEWSQREMAVRHRRDGVGDAQMQIELLEERLDRCEQAVAVVECQWNALSQ
ncbi:hypothetical protein CH63R_14643 [Colletotrichum higginsianum IMI 349063]|uniref:Uncharacterized protein n=1 Tax=Colletotrichum higginsianum (strain IMI 349063) TaxID=759273 RepID=A0A1B7XQP1_COLHI|nr:hypothetical protein CH63R_14643 [Colletotrichum higginsianum IMI 349063]OBR02071.1 hypothetical protein CH63R_14643 [Colletotrichum higginsianum IMI 349063]